MKILVVDDFGTTRRIIKKLLRDIGYSDVDEAEDGLDAISRLDTKHFDFVVTDWNMPNVSGLELVKHIRQTKNVNELPILMVSAETKREMIIEAVQAGVNGYITKPFNEADLKSKIQKILERFQQS